MDATFTSIVRLWEQGYTQTQISRKLNLSLGKVRKVLLTVGLIETDESKFLKQGFTVEEIAKKQARQSKPFPGESHTKKECTMQNIHRKTRCKSEKPGRKRRRLNNENHKSTVCSLPC